MASDGSSRPEESWASVSDLSEYAYCPRAFYYRHHPPEAPPPPEVVARQRSGTRYHQRQLAVEAITERHRDLWVLLALGAATVLAAVALWWLWT
jgi:CRISPR/Cas system-associated exonuclease Cas4 (RecB family)